MALKSKKSLRSTLVQRGILSTSLPVLFLGLLSVLISGITLYRAINNRNYTIVRQGSLQVEKHIATLQKDIRLLAQEIEEGAEHELHLHRFMKNHPEYSTAWITNSEGVITFASPSNYSLVGLDKSRSEAFQGAMEDKTQPHFSNTTISFELQEPVVAISYPLGDGIIALEYRTRELNRYMANVAEDQGFYLVLSDKTGTWITHPDSTKVIQRDRDPNGEYLKSIEADKRDSLWIRFEGKLASYFFKKNKNAGWMITIYQPLSVIFTPLILLMCIIMIIGLLLVLFSFLETRATLSKTIKPIENFASMATAVSNGEYNLTLPEVTFSEMEILRNALQTMAGSIQEREQKQRELWEQLVQSQKMEVVGALAGGIAHDFNNILTAIGGFAELLKVKLPPDSKEALYASEINNSVTRASALTRQLLTFSRKEEVEITEVEVVSCITSIMSMLHRIVGEDISLSLHNRVSEGYIKADHHHLEQVLLNLTVNAADALHEQYCKKPEIKIHILKSEKHITITVEDNAGGIPDDVIDHIFEPFFTTKEIGKGTGMGLSTVKGIIDQHSAEIVIDTDKSGTMIKTIWPICTPAEKEQTAERIPKSLQSLSILFTDDEPMLRSIGETMLEQLGHHVVIAKEGKDALELLDKSEQLFDLLITDLIMPGGMNGDELANIVSERWPSVKILFLSGYTDNHLDNVGIVHKDKVHFLQKPFRIDELQEAIEKRFLDSTT